jgi:cyclopropane-fatty-acyl-phospholipid synthase
MQYIRDKVRSEFLKACESAPFGRLQLTTPEGSVHNFGQAGHEAEIEIHDWSVVTSLAKDGDVGLGRSYGAGLFDTPSIEALAKYALHNYAHFDGFGTPGFFGTLKYRFVDTILRANSVRGSARNIRAHYDVGNEFYQLWLDESMTYSSALFSKDDTDLGRGQFRKYDRILDRLDPQGDVLEIGCGWGGFAERAADRGQDVTAITVSPSQKGYADAKLDGRAKVVLQDYRETEGKFDNIVSIEMIEAVGMRYWPSYFNTLKTRLADGGRAVVQAIIVPDNNFEAYRTSTDYIRTNIFPGGMLLSQEMIDDQAKRAGLSVSDTFSFGQDYALTCRTWANRLTAQTDKIYRLGYGTEFVRHWQYYLEICAAAFAYGQTDVVQVELQHA